jgi:WhiB family redox-sensing transcriptional regulator
MPDRSSTHSAPNHLLPIATPDIIVNGPLGPWSELAICTGEDPDIFFPAHGDTGAKARQICANCPVSEKCREYATQADEFGIWGGLDQEERRTLLIKRASARGII